MRGWLHRVTGYALARRRKLGRKMRRRRIDAGIARLRREGLRVGANCVFVDVPRFSEPHLVEIGDGVTIAANVTFVTHDGVSWHLAERAKLGLHRERIVVGDGVGIGFGAIILPGVTVGPGSIVTAGASCAATSRPGRSSSAIPHASR